MPLVELTHSFQRQLKKIFKKFPKSEKRITEEISELEDNPDKGELYPGYGGLGVRKFRIDLPEYKISGRKALRLIHIYIVTKDKAVPLMIYQKSKSGEEQDRKNFVKKRLKEMTAELAEEIKQVNES